MLTRIPTAKLGETVEDVRARILDPKATWDTVSYVYVLDERKHLEGVLSIKELLRAKPETLMKKFDRKTLVTVHAHAHASTVANRAVHHGLKAIPIVDDDRVFLGVVGTDAILDTLEREHSKHILSFSGVKTNVSFLDVVSARTWKLIQWRTPWLIAGLFGGMVATSLVAAFSVKLEETISLAFFIPVIVYMGAAVGNQTQTIFIRSLVVEKFDTKTYILKEIVVDLAMGLFAAIAIYVFAFLFTRSMDVAMVVSGALFVVMATAGVIGVAIPLVLLRLRLDPSVGGGPFTTIIQDLLSLLIYFGVATAFLL